MSDLKQLVGIAALVLFAGCDKPWCKDGDEVTIDFVQRVRVNSDGESCFDYIRVVGQCETWLETYEQRYSLLPGQSFSFTEAATGDCLVVRGGQPEIVDGVLYLDCSESTYPGCCELNHGEQCTDAS